MRVLTKTAQALALLGAVSALGAPGGVGTNGGVFLNGTSFNGLVLNGWSLNGVSMNGKYLNGPGVVLQGTSPRGVAAEERPDAAAADLHVAGVRLADGTELAVEAP